MLWRLSVLLAVIALLPVCVVAAPTINSFTGPDNAGIYEKCEVTADITTVATNLLWPYDPMPAANTPDHPNAVPAGVGVSVDGLFLPPGQTNWNDATVQHAFYAQMFQQCGEGACSDRPKRTDGVR